MNRKSLSALVARWPAFQPEAGLCRRASLVAAFMIAGTAAATSSAQTAAAPSAESAQPAAATPADPAAAQPQSGSDWRSVFKMSSRLLAPPAGASAVVASTPRAAAPAAAPAPTKVALATVNVPAANVPAAAAPAAASVEQARAAALLEAAGGAQTVLAQAPVTPATPATPVAPVTPTAPAAAQRSATWDVRVADVAISRTLKRWGEQAGYQVVWSSPKDFPVAATASITGDFHEALKTIIESLAQTDSPVMAVYYLNNVVQIVRYTGQAAELKGKN